MESLRLEGSLPSIETVVRAVIHGRVQGVGFRAWTASVARDKGLEGWVRNRRDGTVEAVFRGADHLVQQMLELCGRGPPAARVDLVEINPADVEEVGKPGFEQRDDLSATSGSPSLGVRQ